MVGLTTLQNRVARLGKKRQSQVERVCGSIEAFEASVWDGIMDDTLSRVDMVDVLAAVRGWHDDPLCWRPV